MQQEKIINDYDKIIKYVIKKLGLGKYYDEYYDIGLIGFVNALNTYDETKNIKLITYAYACVKNEILREVLKRGMQKRDFKTISLNAIVNKNEDANLEVGDLIGYVVDDTRKYYLEEIMDSLLDRLSYFKDEQQEMYKSYYGIDNHKKMSVEQLAIKFNKSQSRIRQIIDRINNIMKFYLKEYRKGYFETDFDITPQVVIYNLK